MKAFTKLCFILSGLLMAVGMILCVVGGIGGGMHETVKAVRNRVQADSHNRVWWWERDDDYFDSDDTEEASAEELSIDVQAGRAQNQFSGVGNLHVTMNVGTLNLVKHSENTIKVEADNVRADYVCVQEGNTLVIEDSEENGWEMNSPPKITVYVPENLTFQDVDMEVEVGKIETELFSVNNLEVDCAIGKADIQADIKESGGINCDTGMINLNLQGSQKDFNYSLEGNMGVIQLDGQKFTDMFDGEKIIDQKANKNLDVECSVGKVEIDFNK